MKFSDLVVLLPCTSLEDLSLDWSVAEAEELLSAYTALWHPVLVASAGSMPRWARAEDPPQAPEGALIVVPSVCESRLPPDWLLQSEGWGLRVLRRLRHREEIVSAALEHGEAPQPKLCPELVQDFFALGYAHLVAELVTRQIRYMSNLDEVRLGREVVSAAQAALQGQTDLAQDHLRSALDVLVEAREYYYPVENHLLDLTVLAMSTLGTGFRRSLEAALEQDRPTNLLVGAPELEYLARQDPDTFQLLRRAWSEKKIGLLVGGKDESPLPILPLEAVLENIQEGVATCQRLLGQRPRLFGRRRYGLTVLLPQILAGLGLEGVFHGALDEGRFPTSHQSKIRWEGLDGTTVDGLARVPFDAAQADTFLRIVRCLGDTLDWDQTSMVMLAHWPGQSSPWLDDLHRISRLSKAVGRFLTVEDYLEQTRYAGQQKKYSPDEYRTPYLRQEVARHGPDPISRWVYYHRVRMRWEQLRTLQFLVESITGLPLAPAPLAELQETIRTIAAQEGPFRPDQWPHSSAQRKALEETLEALSRQWTAQLAERLYPGVLLGPPNTPPQGCPNGSISEGTDDACSPTSRVKSSTLPWSTKTTGTSSELLPQKDATQPDRKKPLHPERNTSHVPEEKENQGGGGWQANGVLIVNPASFTRQRWFSVESGPDLVSQEGLRLAGRQQGRLHVACEIPGMGFGWVELGQAIPESGFSFDLPAAMGQGAGQTCPSPSGSNVPSGKASEESWASAGPSSAGRSEGRSEGTQKEVSSNGEKLAQAEGTAAGPLTEERENLASHGPTGSCPEDGILYPPPKPPSWAAQLIGKPPRSLPPLAEVHLVRNEFFEARLDPATGALRGVYGYGSRRPRCAQQLAMRIPKPRAHGSPLPDEEQNYTIMAADQFRILSAGPVMGQVEVRGRLMTSGGELAARFTEIFRCRRGDPVLEILIHLEPHLLPEADPWNSYYACRFAWADQTAELFRGVHQSTCRTETDRIESPWFIELRTDKERTCLLFGGLPYHRRIGVHKLDTLLIVQGETARDFRVGIGVDLKHPQCAAWDFLAPAVALPIRKTSASQTELGSLAHQGWLFHVNVRNVLATAWQSIVEQGQVRGFWVRLLETEGRATTASLRTLRPVLRAAQVSFTGQYLRDLPAQADTIQVPFHAYQYLQVEARYAE